ncbi:MAG: short-chain dehydrogenase [Porphyromonadaceae bacterium CG2_30_38_12]|nr:MAG: short-chain dehydrogenase [Porphyromonadaceae bacterium CG2_30_38_12]
MSKTSWTTNNIPSLSGKIIIVTGGNSGLGYEAVKAYASKNAQVILACRDLSKGENAKQEILKTLPNGLIDVMMLNLADLSSVKDFADSFQKKYKQLHILLNNAGIMMTPYQQTVDGIEMQQGTNHFGHYALTGLLLPVLKKTPAARVVNVSSMAHKQGVMDFDNLLYSNGLSYSPLGAYGRSKLENLLFTYGLQAYLERNKLDIKCVVGHPGVSDTNLFAHIGSKFLQTLLSPIFKLFIQPASMGVLPELRASMDENVQGGEYFGPDGWREMKGYPVLVQPNPSALHKVHIQKLWQVSEELTKVKYPEL